MELSDELFWVLLSIYDLRVERGSRPKTQGVHAFRDSYEKYITSYGYANSIDYLRT